MDSHISASALPQLTLYRLDQSLTPKLRPSNKIPESSVYENKRKTLPVVSKSRSPKYQRPDTSTKKKQEFASFEDDMHAESMYLCYRMKPHLYILKTLKRQHAIEREGTPRPLQFNKFFERLSDNMKKFQRSQAKNMDEDEELKDAVVIESKHEPRVLTSKDAFIRTAEMERHLWMKRRKKDIHGEAIQVSECISALFELMDTKKVESIEGSEFVSQLLSLGLSNDPRTLVNLLELSFKEDISTLQLTKNDLLKFCKGSHRTDQILSMLMKKIHKSQQLRGNDPEPSPVSDQRKSPASPRSVTNPPKRNLKSTVVYPALSDYMSLIKQFWEELELDSKYQAKKEQVELKLCALHIAPDILEAKKMLLYASSQVTFEQFQALFARSILKGALIALDQKLIKITPIAGNFSIALKISTYKRRLLLAGINSHHRSPQSQQQGATALKALEMFQKMQTTETPT